MNVRWVVFGASAALALSACSQGGTESASVATTVTETITQTVPVDQAAETITVSETVTVEVTPTQEAAAATPPESEAENVDDAADASDSGEEEVESEAAVETLDVPSANRALGLDDFFGASDGWEGGRWNVANRENEQGIAALVYNQRSLELRLQNQFTTLRFDAGQANDSPSSSCTSQVDILVDGALRETRSFEFNVIQPFEGIDITDGNAVKIISSTSGCSDSVRLVLSRIQVE